MTTLISMRTPEALLSATYNTASQNPSQSQSYTNAFTSLPAEIKQAIFCYLPDVASLKSLVLSHSSFYHVYLDAESLLLGEILRRQIGSDMIAFATVLSKSYSLRPWSKAGVLDYLAHLRQHDAPILWTLPQALYVSRLHSHVEFFTGGFAAMTLTDTTQKELSNNERLRITRSFYLFELYCNLFRARKSSEIDRFSAEELRDLFFTRFAPWENEQLGCIHDYLFEQFSIAFNDVAEHDVLWGELYVAYVNDYDSCDNLYKEHYLSLGLAYLRQVATARDYDQRFDLIHPNLGSDGCFLFDGLKKQDDNDGTYFPLEDYTSTDWDKFIRKPFFVDHNSGPIRAWSWAHAESSGMDFYFREDQHALRLQGYVMWDYSRIAQWDCFHNRWHDIADTNHEREEVDRRNAAMVESFHMRSEVYRRGGSGWWSPGDESKVKWRPRVVEKIEPDRSFSKRKQFIEEMKAWRTNLKHIAKPVVVIQPTSSQDLAKMNQI